jgi:hypothetical protein
MQNTSLLTAARVRSGLSDFVAIGLDKTDASGNLSVQWIRSKVETQALLSSVDFSYEHRAAVNAKTTDRLYLLTESGDVYAIDLYEITRGVYGYALGDGVYWRTGRDFATRLEEIFEFPAYSSTERYHELALRIFQSGRDGLATPPDAHALGEGSDPARVVFYAPDHNRTFAQTLQNQDPEHVVISEMGADSSPAVLAQRLKLIKETRAISQIIFACHGAAAMFDGGPKTAPVNSATGIGLYPLNTKPGAFGALIESAITYSGTITLLSCETAATTIFEGATLDGKNVLSQLASAAKAWVVASDAAVIIQGSQGVASTGGTIYACSPKGPIQVLMSPVPGQIFPLYAMPTIKAAAA